MCCCILNNNWHFYNLSDVCKAWKTYNTDLEKRKINVGNVFILLSNHDPERLFCSRKTQIPTAYSSLIARYNLASVNKASP